MRSEAQFERMKRLEMREQREKELALLAAAQSSADERYVRSVVAGIWTNLYQRKLQAPIEELPRTERERLQVLVALEGGYVTSSGYCGA